MGTNHSHLIPTHTSSGRETRSPISRRLSVDHFLNFPFGSFTSKQLAFTSGYRSMKRHRINTPRAAPFPSRSSGWGILTTCGSKCSCALFTRKSNAARDVLFVQETHPEVFQKLSHFRVPGQGQRSTPAARATGLTYFCLRGRMFDALSA